MTVATLGDSFHPYSREDQTARGPKRKPGTAQDKAAYEDAIEAARDPKTGYVICYLCGEPCAEGDYALDHKTPRGRGGKTTKENLGPCHPACHTGDHARGKRKPAKDPVTAVTRKT